MVKSPATKAREEVEQMDLITRLDAIDDPDYLEKVIRQAQERKERLKTAKYDTLKSNVMTLLQGADHSDVVKLFRELGQELNVPLATEAKRGNTGGRDWVYLHPDHPGEPYSGGKILPAWMQGMAKAQRSQYRKRWADMTPEEREKYLPNYRP